ncbi:MAG: type IV secretory system conjugative DNA transfer family protein [Devosia sp.]
MSIAKIRLVGGLCLAVAVVIINSTATQYVAEHLSYHPALGSPLFGTAYMPFAWWQWAFSFYAHAPRLYETAFYVVSFATTICLAAFIFAVGLSARSSKKHEGTHGTAAFATLDQVVRTGMLPKNGRPGRGAYCGGFDSPSTGRTEYLRHDGPEHVCVIAPTRSGKGVGNIVPTLLSWHESVFVLDRKGENYEMTAGWRSTKAGNTVLRLDPAEPTGSCAWNALGEIRFGTRYQIADTQNIALMVIDDDGKGIAGNHFRSAAWELICGLILHALYKSVRIGREASLPDCAHMLTGVGIFAPAEKQKSGDDGDNPKILGELFQEMINVSLPDTIEAMEAQLVIKGVGRRMANTPSRELGSIISTANNALALYRDPIVGENTSRSDFKVIDLMDAENPVSLYFITTPRNADRMKPLARLLLTQIVSVLADRMEFSEGRSITAHKHRLLLMLDEFPTLGKLEVFESALAFIAGYGIKAYIIIQDVTQLYKTYTKFESIISNCHIRVIYAPNNLETAEWLSKMTGQTTVINEQVSISGKRFGIGAAGQFSSSFHSSQRPLMTADEIMRLPGLTENPRTGEITPGEMLIFVAGQPVIKGRQILYFLDPTFNERSRIEPPKVSDTITRKQIGFAAT